jgi:hypothetical protein
MILTTNAISRPVALSPEDKNQQRFITFFYEMRRSRLRVILDGSIGFGFTGKTGGCQVYKLDGLIPITDASFQLKQMTVQLCS